MAKERRPRKFDFVASDSQEYVEFTGLLSPALDRLPNHVSEWARKNVVFVAQSQTTPAWYLHMARYKQRRGLILLTERFKSAIEGDRSFIVAHEIAHAYLNREMSDIMNIPIEEEREEERQVTELAKSWLAENRHGRV
jgi:Zn-dependent peptidase ImmA (M78 family)